MDYSIPNSEKVGEENQAEKEMGSLRDKKRYKNKSLPIKGSME